MSRISVVVEPALHRAVLAAAAARGCTIQEFMLAALAAQLRQETNRQDTAELFAISSPAHQRDWDNEYDAAYDDPG